jgi:hypothetical protein
MITHISPAGPMTTVKGAKNDFSAGGWNAFRFHRGSPAIH